MKTRQIKAIWFKTPEWKAQRARIVARMKAGHRIPAIQLDEDVSRQALYRLRDKLGLGKKGMYLGPEKKLEACRLWNEGELGINQIAEQVCVPEEKVRYFLETRHGFPGEISAYLSRRLRQGGEDAQPHA